jgi:hypothetical protein
LRTLRPIVTLIAVAAIAYGLFYFFFPPADKVIRKRISKLSEAISARPQGNIATVANVNRIGSFFHPNVSVRVEGFGADVRSVDGRGELTRIAMAARQHNVAVQVEGKTNATVSATALVRISDDNNPTPQQVQLQFEKVGRDWLIRSAAPQKSLKPE